MAANKRNLQKIGIMKVKQANGAPQTYDVLYLGGSTFVINFGEQQATIGKAKIDELIQKGQLGLVSEDEYQRICDAIDPTDGSTKTHRADGTEKSEVEKMLTDLQEETVRNSAPASPNGPEPMVDPFGDDEDDLLEEPSRWRRDDARQPDPAHGMTRSRPAPSDDPFGEDPGMGFHSLDEGRPFGARGDAGRAQQQADPRDDGTDGDAGGRGQRQGDSRGMRRSSGARVGASLAVIAATLVGCVACFVLAMGFTSKSSWDLSSVPVIGSYTTQDAHDAQDDRSDLPASERIKQGETSATTKGQSGLEIVVRSDFDPEDAVVGYALANGEMKQIAIGFFQAVRVAYSNGDVDMLNSMIAYGVVHDQVADAYARAEQARLMLTDEEREAIRGQYREVMDQREAAHVANHDVDASIYCGRVREVRADDTDAMRMYVVMESLAGDHQRICFVLQGDAASGAYALVGITDADGYVRMVMEGEVA